MTAIGGDGTSVNELVHGTLGHAQRSSAPEAYLVWFTHRDPDADADAETEDDTKINIKSVTLDEIKAGASRYGCDFPPGALPTRTLLAE